MGMRTATVGARVFHVVFHLLGDIATIYTLLQLVQSAFKHKRAVRAIAIVAFTGGFLYAMSLVVVVFAPMFMSLTSDNPFALPYLNYPLTLGNYELAGVVTIVTGLFIGSAMRSVLTDDRKPESISYLY